MTKEQIETQLDRHAHYDDTWELKYLTTSTVQVKGKEDGEGNESIRFFALGRMWNGISDATINTATAGYNGYLAGNAKTNSRYLLLWAIFNDTGTAFRGFGVTNRPQEVCTNMSSGTKGATCTLTLSNGFSFTIGSLVSVWTSDSDYNAGTVVATTATTIQVSLYNDATYGTNLSGTTPTVIQYNKFRPYSLFATTQTLAYSKYKLLSDNQLYVNSSGNIQVVSKMLSLPEFMIIYWHKNIGATAEILDWRCMECNGQRILNPLSRMWGIALPNINSTPADPAGGAASTYSAGRFIRGTTGTTGTLESDLFQAHWHESADPTKYIILHYTSAGDGTNAVSGAGTTQIGFTRTGQAITDTVHGTPRNDKETRPVNIEMSAIMRVV